MPKESFTVVISIVVHCPFYIFAMNCQGSYSFWKPGKIGRHFSSQVISNLLGYQGILTRSYFFLLMYWQDEKY